MVAWHSGWSRSTKLLYAGPSSTGMGECLRAGKPPRFITSHSWPTQPSILSGAENGYQPNCCDTLQLGSKGRYGSFHLWINVWVASKTVWSLVPYLSTFYTHNCCMALFSRLLRWASARKNLLLDFMVQGKIKDKSAMQIYGYFTFVSRPKQSCLGQKIKNSYY